MVEFPEPERMRALLAVMREFGATHLACGTFSITVAPAPLVKPGHTSKLVEDDEDDDDAAREQSEEDKLRAAWDKHWNRMLLSSGAPTPPFPGLEKAKSLGIRS